MTKLMVNCNSMLAFLGGNSRNPSAMKHRIKLGYSDTVSEHIRNYDQVGLSHYDRVCHALLDGISVTGKTVLDVGCGTGTAAFCALGRGATRILGSDLSRTMIRACNKKVRDIGLDDSVAGFKQCDAERLDYSDNSVDVAISNLMLGFVPEPLKALKEMARVVRSGGDIAIATHGPRHYWEACEAALMAIDKRHVLGYRMEFWPREEAYIKRLLLKAGFANIRTGNYVWQEEMEDPGKAFDFFAGTSGMWWYSKYPPEERKRDAARVREYFHKKKVSTITSDVILAYARKP